MTPPTVHLNGTGRQELVGQIADIAEALESAIATMRAGWPHGRDYYPQGAAALEAAQAVYLARAQVLDAMRDEFMTEALAIYLEVTP